MTRTHDPAPMTGLVEAVSLSATHVFSKEPRDAVRLLAGLGVAGDTHRGETVQHRSRVARDPTQPNLRQVHLIAGELHDELVASGFAVGPGDLGENVTTRGLDLLALPTGTVLHLGLVAEVQVTGTRTPCAQLDGFAPGLRKAVMGRDDAGQVIPRAGVMAVVITTGDVRRGDPITVDLPPPPHQPLQRV